MPIFTPPTARIRPPYLEDSTPEQVGLYRHFETRLAGVNVYQLQDGSFVQDFATPENSATNVPYPLNPLDLSMPYVYVTNWDGSVTQVFVPNPCVAIFYGGHEYEITDAQATALTNYTAHGLGYGDCITSDTQQSYSELEASFTSYATLESDFTTYESI